MLPIKSVCFIKPACFTKSTCSTKPMCPVLVRSCESLEKQNLCCTIDRLNRRVNRLQGRLSNIIGQMVNTSTNPICKGLTPMCIELSSTKKSFDLFNLCCRARTVNRRVKQLEKVINSFTNQNNFFPPINGKDICIKNICCKVKILERRVNKLEDVINFL